MVLPERKRKIAGLPSPVANYGLMLNDNLRWVPVLLTDEGYTIVAGNEGILLQDDDYSAIVSITGPHFKIHEGVMYEATVYNAALANAGTLIMSTPDPIGMEVHFSFEGSCGGDATLELIEGATPTGGAGITPHNMNRNVADPAFIPLEDPALAGGAVVGGPILLAGGEGPKAGGGSASSREGLEWITDPTEPYAVRLTNISGNTQPASIAVNFYMP